MASDAKTSWADMSEAARKSAYERHSAEIARLTAENLRLRAERNNAVTESTKLQAEVGELRELAEVNRKFKEESENQLKSYQTRLSDLEGKVKECEKDKSLVKLQCDKNVSAKEIARLEAEERALKAERDIDSLREQLEKTTVSSQHNVSFGSESIPRVYQTPWQSNAKTSATAGVKHVSLLVKSHARAESVPANAPQCPTQNNTASARIFSSTFAQEYEKISTFSGFGDDNSVLEFLTAFDKLFSLFGSLLPVSERAVYLVSKLDGHAERAYVQEQSKRGKRMDIYEISDLLLSTYSTEQFKMLAEQKIETLIQREDESVSSFVGRLYELAKQTLNRNDFDEFGNPSYDVLDQKVCRQLIRGLLPEIQNLFYALPRPVGDTTEQMIQRILSAEMCIAERQNQRNLSSKSKVAAAISTDCQGYDRSDSESDLDYGYSDKPQDSFERDNFEYNRAYSNLQNKRCFNCNKLGHLARNCWMPDRELSPNRQTFREDRKVSFGETQSCAAISMCRKTQLPESEDNAESPMYHLV